MQRAQRPPVKHHGFICQVTNHSETLLVKALVTRSQTVVSNSTLSRGRVYSCLFSQPRCSTHRVHLRNSTVHTSGINYVAYTHPCMISRRHGQSSDRRCIFQYMKGPKTRPFLMHFGLQPACTLESPSILLFYAVCPDTEECGSDLARKRQVLLGIRVHQGAAVLGLTGQGKTLIDTTTSVRARTDSPVSPQHVGRCRGLRHSTYPRFDTG